MDDDNESNVNEPPPAEAAAPMEDGDIPSTPPRPPPQAAARPRLEFSDDDDDDDDNNNSVVVPATPGVVAASTSRNRSSALEETPSTPASSASNSGRGPPATPPLTPLEGLDDDDDDDDDEEQEQDTAAAVNDNDNDVNMDANEDQEEQDEDMDMEDITDATTVARGTNVNVPVAAATFSEFLRSFVLEPEDNNDNDDDEESDSDNEENQENRHNLYYMTKLEQLLHRSSASSSNSSSSSSNTASLALDTRHLYNHNAACQRLYKQLVAFPMELIPLLDLVVQRELQRLATTAMHQENDEHDDQDELPIPTVQVRPYNLRVVSNLRELDPIHMDTLVCFKGMIVRSSPIIPDLKVAHFECVICGTASSVRIDRGRIVEPRHCESCNTRDSFQLLHNRSLFTDKQLVRVQETPDQVPAGQTPASVVTFCFDDLVDACPPGSKVEITGVLRAQPLRVHPKLSKLKSIYKTYIDVIHFSTRLDRSSDNKGGNSHWSPARIQQLQQLSQQPDIYQQLTDSLAPSIWELENVKKGILCMLFGGNTVKKPNKRRNGAALVRDDSDAEQDDDDDDWSDDEDNDDDETAQDTKLHKRGDINILLCGDPGTSKSQLLSYVHKLSSRGIYTSGKGSSAVGLTASVVRDPETRDLVLESGALVLSDQGICCIDEFDKMSDATRSILHEAMEQQTVSIAKAGIIASLNARTSILASANPLESRYNPNISVVENIQLPPTLLSRFDLIYLILDAPNAEQDRRLAQHLCGLYYETPQVVQPPMDTQLLKDYIDYARQNIHPRLSNEATEELLESYLELRGGGNTNATGTRTISATPRQLESLIRTSEALAKMRYSDTVTRHDAKEAVRLLKVATQAAATDPRTGRIDMDMISTGRTTNTREADQELYTALKELIAQRRGARMAIRQLVEQVSEIVPEASHDAVVSAVKQLQADGMLQYQERAQSIFVRTGMVA